MTQTTLAVSCRDADVEISANGTTWTDIGGFATSVTPGKAKRQTGEAYTLDGDTSIITKGKREPQTLEVKVIYTEGVSDAAMTVYNAFRAGTDIYLRYAPKGNTTGNTRYTTTAGVVEECEMPKIEAEDAKPLLFGFSLKVADVVPGTIAT